MISSTPYDSNYVAEVARLSTSDRLRLWASKGAMVRTWGPIEEHASHFAARVIDARKLHPWGRVHAEANWDLTSQAAQSLHLAGRWAQFGFNVFDLSPDLAAAFLLTDPAPIEGELKLPFPCFFIRLPPGIVPVFVHGQQHWAEGIWCHRFVSYRTKDGASAPFFRWTIEWKWVNLWTDRAPTDVEGPSDGPMYNQIWNGDPPHVPEDEISTDRALRIIRNLVSWLDASGGIEGHTKPQPPHVKRNNKDRRHILETGAWPHVWFFGGNVKLRPELRRLAREFALASSEKHSLPGWQLHVKHAVRGHWKRQAHGEGLALRKRRWIEPYWRGPEGAAAWAHIYEVGDQNP